MLGQRFDADNAAIKRRIGVMPETLGLFEPLYAHEFLAFVARMFGLDEATTRKRVTELLDALELTDTSKTLSEYSTGMRKRVAFAAAVIHSPEVLFLDEPFESIDPAGVSLMKQWLRRFTEQGRTVFITSHVLETVERVCQEVAIVTRPGKLVWQGDITALANDGAVQLQRPGVPRAGAALPAPHRRALRRSKLAVATAPSVIRARVGVPMACATRAIPLRPRLSRVRGLRPRRSRGSRDIPRSPRRLFGR